MHDNNTNLKQLKDVMKRFVDAREWHKFHTPKNLSMALSIEVAELMEKLQWIESVSSLEQVEQHREAIEQELADVFSYLLAFANVCNIDVTDAFIRKMALNEQKYPVDKVKGRSDKYTHYV